MSHLGWVLVVVDVLLALSCSGPAGSGTAHPSKHWVLPWHAVKHTLGTAWGGHHSHQILVPYSPKAIWVSFHLLL